MGAAAYYDYLESPTYYQLLRSYLLLTPQLDVALDQQGIQTCIRYEVLARHVISFHSLPVSTGPSDSIRTDMEIWHGHSVGVFAVVPDYP